MPQVLGAFEAITNGSHLLHRQLIEMPTPIVTDHLGQQLALVGFQCLDKQAAAVEGMLTQHPIAPAMDGRDRRFIHPLTRQLQPARAIGPVLRRVLGTQLLKQFVVLALRFQKALRRFGQTRSNTVA
ncbi:hypothetical protein D3C76_803990 [compost metagenome]